MTNWTYYQRNRDVILNRAKNYYGSNREKLIKHARGKYKNLSEEEKDKKGRIWKQQIPQYSEERK